MSVLRQLAINLTERSREYVRQGSETDPRRVEWFRDGDYDSGLTASDADRDKLRGVAGRAWLEAIDHEVDSSRSATRLYVEGAGAGVAALTLAKSTDTYAGYTVNTADSYVEVTGATPVVARFEKFSHIKSSSEMATEQAANELLAEAVAALANLYGNETIVPLALRDLHAPLRAGDAFAVEAAKELDDGAIVDLSADYVAQSVKWLFSADGVRCEVSARDSLRDDTSTTRRRIEALEAAQRTPQPIDSAVIQRSNRQVT